MPMMQSRRRFLTTLSLAGTAGLVGVPRALAADGPLETTAIRLGKGPNICNAPQLVAEELLRAEGFTDIRYDQQPPGVTTPEPLGRGVFDLNMGYASGFAAAIDAGEPITVLAGVMVGCVEVFANQGIRGIADMKGKSAGVPDYVGAGHALLAVMAAHVGLDPNKDIRWVTGPSVKQQFVDGKIDAYLSQPPDSQDLRARQIGHVIVNTAVDRPWSQYFCCMLGANREYARRNPVATKRALRAILKATDLCATEPDAASRRLVDRGFTARYDYALQTLRENSYEKWREYDAEDTLRFYALRMHDAGFIKASPQKIIADGTDWRFLNELKRELKA
jgi:NitT/TauT family transport system substrate-binding protein